MILAALQGRVGRHGVSAESAPACGAMLVATPVVVVMVPLVDSIVALRLATTGATCEAPAAAGAWPSWSPSA